MKNHFTHCIKHRELGNDHIVSRHRDIDHAEARLKWYDSPMYYIEEIELEHNCEAVK